MKKTKGLNARLQAIEQKLEDLLNQNSPLDPKLNCILFYLLSLSHKNSYAETVYLRKDMSSTQRKRFQNYVEKFLNWFWKEK